MNWIDKACNETVWLTPDILLKPVRDFFGGDIPLDPATQASNPTNAKIFFTKDDNGLEQPWDFPVFVNPPYGKIIQDWCSKIHQEAVRMPARPILALLPCGSGRPGTRYWQRDIFQKHLNIICYVKGRINFMNASKQVIKGNTYPSHILGFNVDTKKFIDHFQHLGKVLKITVVNS